MTTFASVSIPPAPCGAWDCTGCQSVQISEPNPILVDARRYYAERRNMGNPKGWAHVLRKVDYAIATSMPWSDATEEHAIHARRVLSRLANPTEGENA